MDGGFDCPNRDGTVAHGGCTFCSAAGSGDFAGNRADSIAVQFKEIKEKMHEMARRKIYCLFSGIYKYTCTS